MLDKSLTVTQLNGYVKSLIENDVRLNIVSVSGEISNFKNHYASGHWYFTLKDANASVRCVMFRMSAARVKFTPQDGAKVTLRGRVSLYEKDGQYQFYAEEMHTEGEGDLALAYKQTLEKLRSEGLFDAQTKRPLVKYPKRIAVITSDTGAAVRDILNILNERFPSCEVLMCPVAVQGDAAVGDMINALDRVYALCGVDTIIIGRGGGSIEDLWAFNSELLARKIYESPIPVISAVGHETDFTICDFVADVRASTPSHAAELAVPDYKELSYKISELKKRIEINLISKYELSAAKVKNLTDSLSKQKAESIFINKQLLVDTLNDKIIKRVSDKINSAQLQSQKLFVRLDTLSPLKTLARGYSVVTRNNAVAKSVGELSENDDISIRFADGTANARITEITERK